MQSDVCCQQTPTTHRRMDAITLKLTVSLFPLKAFKSICNSLFIVITLTLLVPFSLMNVKQIIRMQSLKKKS